MIPLREIVIRFLLACIALNMKVTLYPLAKFWGYRRFEPQPDSVLVTCAAVRANQGRSAGPPGGCSRRQAMPRVARSAAGLGRPTGCAALPLTGHRAPHHATHPSPRHTPLPHTRRQAQKLLGEGEGEGEGEGKGEGEGEGEGEGCGWLTRASALGRRCCTNGLGHIHQMERVLGVLQEGQG
jgi:hypothetical protein